MVLVSGHSQGGGGNKDSGREGRGHPGAEILKQTRWPVTGVTRGTSHHQFIVRLIDGADMSLSPGKHGHTGLVLTTMPGLRETILIFTQLDNSLYTALGSPSLVTQLCQAVTRPILFRSFLFAQRFEPTKLLAGR